MPRSSNRRVLLEAMEKRVLMDASVPLATIYSYAQANFQSVDASLAFVPATAPTVSAGQYLTVNVSSGMKITLFCSHAGSTATVNGATTATTPISTPGGYDFGQGGPLADAGADLTLAAGTYQVSFFIASDAPTEGMIQQTNSDGSTQDYEGNWVSAGGVSPNGPYTSPLPFFVTNTNHLAVISQPKNPTVNTVFSPPLQIAIEDANNNIITADSSTSITLSDAADIDVFTGGTGTVQAVNGVATFSDLSNSFPQSFDVDASTQGVNFNNGYPQLAGLVLSGEIFIKVTASGGGGGGGSGGTGSGVTPVVTQDTVPSSAIAGTKIHGSVKLKLTNSSSTTERGFTTNLYASTDTTLDTSSDVLILTAKDHASLKIGKSTTQSLSITKLPATLPAGNYYLIAETVDSAGNTESVTTSSLVNAVAPVITLTPTIPTAPKVARNGTASVTLLITNNGNIPPTGRSEIQLFASTSPSATGATLLLSKRTSLSLKPGKSSKLTFHLTKAMVLAIQTQGSLVVEVTDPLGNSQTVFTVLSM